MQMQHLQNLTELSRRASISTLPRFKMSSTTSDKLACTAKLKQMCSPTDIMRRVSHSASPKTLMITRPFQSTTCLTYESTNFLVERHRLRGSTSISEIGRMKSFELT